MNEQDLERALRHALAPTDPGEDFAKRVMVQIDASTLMDTTHDIAGTAMPNPTITLRARAWCRSAVALAACLTAAIGIAQWQHDSLQARRALQAKAQLFQALDITNANLNVVRDAVAREEELQ